MPQEDIAAQTLAAQVEITILQADLFILFVVPIYDDGSGLGRVEHCDLMSLDFDLSGCHFWIELIRGPHPHDSLDLDDPFRSHLFERLVRHLMIGRMGHDLGQPVAIPENEKQQPTKGPYVVNPASKDHILAGISCPQFTTSLSSIHDRPPVHADRSGSEGR